MASGNYYGIDLGTTNSLIGLFNGSEFELFQNRDRMNATPSAVYVRTAQQKIMGQRALDLIRDDPENGVVEFKRNMGRDDPYYFPKVGLSLTATELSAEILKSLSNDIVRLRGGQSVDSAVITVPASFGVAPCRATVDAAHLAGITNVILLQEPIAAAIAYGVQPGIEDENWLVFDLGGGTFDVAVVSTRNLNLTVISHAGDRYLGGKDVDRELVEKVILPFLETKYILPMRDADAHKVLYAKLLRKAEEAKIALTYEESFLVDLYNLGSDENRESIEMELTITRQELQQCAEEMLSRCLDLSRKAMAEARVEPENIAKVLLVGGATQMPYVRQKVVEVFGIEVEYSRDPITAIVEGAAFFGLTQEGGISTQVTNEQDPLKIVTDVDVVPGDNRAVIQGQVNGVKTPMEVSVYSEITGWASDWVLLDDDGDFKIEVSLDVSQKVQAFDLKLRYVGGEEVKLESNRVNVNRAIAVGAPKLQHSLWIELQDQGGTTFDELFEKGSLLPAEKRDLIYRLARNLTYGSTEKFLPIKIWEGEEPGHLDLVAIIEIPKGSGILIQGQSVEISIRVDDSRILHAQIIVSDSGVVYQPKVILPDEMYVYQRKRFLDARLSENYHTIDRIMPLIVPDTHIGLEFTRLVQEMEKISIRLYEHKDNPEEVDRLSQREKELRSSLKQICAKLIPQVPRTEGIYEEDKRKALARLQEIKGETGDGQLEEEISRLASEISDEDISDRDLGLKLEHANVLYSQVIYGDINFLEKHFNYAKSKQVDMINQKAASEFISQGEEALQRKDTRALHMVVYELYMLFPEQQEEIREMKDLIPGIMRY